MIRLRVNGQNHQFDGDPEMPLLPDETGVSSQVMTALYSTRHFRKVAEAERSSPNLMNRSIRLCTVLFGICTSLCVAASDPDIVIREDRPGAESLTSTASGAVIFGSMT
jgi:hypothetical protein